LLAHNGTVFYNSDNSLLTNMVVKWDRKISYGPTTGTSCKGKVLSVDPYLEVEIENVSSQEDHGKFQIKTNLVGEYNFENVLAAVSIGLYFKVPMGDIQKATGDYVPTNNRSQLSKTSKNQLLLDYYNANPSSTEAAIINFSKIAADNKIIILGDMLELGAETETEHLKIMSILANYSHIKVYLVGNCYKSHAASFGFTAFTTSEELREWLTKNPLVESFILIKGSRGIQLEKIVNVL